MGALKELFGSFEGQLSLLVIVAIIVMAGFFIRMFVKNAQQSVEAEQDKK